MIRTFSSIVFTLGVAFIIAFPTTGNTQTLFEWPGNKFDISEYKYFDKCLAASDRVRDSLYRTDAILADTLRWNEQRSFFVTPHLVADIAARCIEKMDSGSVVPEQYWIAMELYLLTQKYAVAERLVNDRFNKIGSEDTLQRAWFLDSVINRYAVTRPRLIEQADKYADQINSLGTTIPLILHVKVNWTLFQAADSSQNKEAIRKYGSRILEIISRHDRSKLNPEESRAIGLVTAVVTKRLFHTELIDSLRKSTVGYAGLLEESINKILNQGIDTHIGEKLPTLEGDFWFRVNGAKKSYPQTGKISLIYFINIREVASAQALSEYAILRRLQNKFPDMEIVIVAATRGYFGLYEPPSAEREAGLINDLITNLYKVPGILTVTNRPVIPIEAPDGRILSQVIPNAENYPGDPRDPKFGKYYLADEAGLLVSNEIISALEEDRLSDLIQAIRDRNSIAGK